MTSRPSDELCLRWLPRIRAAKGEAWFTSRHLARSMVSSYSWTTQLLRRLRELGRLEHMRSIEDNCTFYYRLIPSDRQ